MYYFLHLGYEVQGLNNLPRVTSGPGPVYNFTTNLKHKITPVRLRTDENRMSGHASPRTQNPRMLHTTSENSCTSLISLQDINSHNNFLRAVPIHNLILFLILPKSATKSKMPQIQCQMLQHVHKTLLGSGVKNQTVPSLLLPEGKPLERQRDRRPEDQYHRR